jgi:hypothetical protein
MLTILLLAACTDTRSLTGQVRDVWGKPVMDATVVVEGVVERYHTDSVGKFEIDVADPVARVMAGKQGYIKDIQPVAAPAEEDADYAPVTLELYPEPEQPGFYAIGPEDYIHLEAKRVRLVGNEVDHYAGLQDIPDEQVRAGTVSFVFSSTLRAAELSQMNLHLSKLEFVDKVAMKQLLGRDAATVNLWVAKQDVPFDLKSLPSRDDYVITTRDALEPGMYAFHAQDVLNEDDERVLMQLPKESQVAFPFEVM